MFRKSELGGHQETVRDRDEPDLPVAMPASMDWNCLQGARLRTWLDSHVRPEFAGRIVPIDDAFAAPCAHLGPEQD